MAPLKRDFSVFELAGSTFLISVQWLHWELNKLFPARRLLAIVSQLSQFHREKEHKSLHKQYNGKHSSRLHPGCAQHSQWHLHSWPPSAIATKLLCFAVIYLSWRRTRNEGNRFLSLWAVGASLKSPRKLRSALLFVRAEKTSSL